MPFPEIPQDDSLEAIALDLSQDPEAGPAFRTALNQKAEAWLTLCVKFAKKMCLLDNYGRGIMILNEAMIWMIEANQRAEREVKVQPPTGGIGIE